eukprot:GILI01008150.1.p1 GENE.GILI01008150.1~~GILI01008150.1.p1  ORF type:complete len:440 (-),score=53.65 GILI01008150.1:67-1308(-)
MPAMQYFGYLLESIVYASNIKNHLTMDVKNDIELMETTAVSLLQTLISPGDRSLVRRARELKADVFQFYHQTDPSPQEIKATIPRYWLSLFAVEPPEVSLGKYLTRLVNELRCDMECFIMALCVLRRVSQKIPVCSRSIHRLFLATSVVVAKTRDDKYYPMSFYARIGGVRKEDIEAMEVSLLNVIGFDAGVTTFEYVDMLYALRVHCAGLAFAQGHDWAQKGWEEIVANLRYPVQQLLSMEVLSLNNSIHFETEFTRDLPSHLKPAVTVPEPTNDDSMAHYPFAIAKNAGEYRTMLHETPFSSISQLPSDASPARATGNTNLPPPSADSSISGAVMDKITHHSPVANASSMSSNSNGSNVNNLMVWDGSANSTPQRTIISQPGSNGPPDVRVNDISAFRGPTPIGHVKSAVV